MAIEIHDQVSTKEYPGRGDRTRGRLHAKQPRFRSSYRSIQTCILICLLLFLGYNLLRFIMPNLFLYFVPVAEEPMLTYTILEGQPLQFTFLDKGSPRGRHLVLVDSHRYFYRVKVRTQ